MLARNPGLKQISHSITGGALVAQGICQSPSHSGSNFGQAIGSHTKLRRKLLQHFATKFAML